MRVLLLVEGAFGGGADASVQLNTVLTEDDVADINSELASVTSSSDADVDAAPVLLGAGAADAQRRRVQGSTCIVLHVVLHVVLLFVGWLAECSCVTAVPVEEHQRSVAALRQEYEDRIRQLEDSLMHTRSDFEIRELRAKTEYEQKLQVLKDREETAREEVDAVVKQHREVRLLSASVGSVGCSISWADGRRDVDRATTAAGARNGGCGARGVEAGFLRVGRSLH